MEVKFTHIQFSGDGEAAREVLRSVGQLLGAAVSPVVQLTATLDTTEEPEPTAAEEEAIADAFPVRLPAPKKRAEQKPARRTPANVAAPAGDQDEVRPGDELAEQIADAIRLDGPQSVAQLAVRFQKHSIAIGKCVSKYSGMLRKDDDGLVCVVE